MVFLLEFEVGSGAMGELVSGLLIHAAFISCVHNYRGLLQHHAKCLVLIYMRVGLVNDVQGLIELVFEVLGSKNIL